MTTNRPQGEHAQEQARVQCGYAHKVQRGRLMRPVLNAANAARDATKGILATCSNPATIDRRKDRGAPPANYSTEKYQRPAFDNLV